MSNFDPYHTWLGISPKDQPCHHYRLLGVDLFESDPNVISTAADRQMSHVRTYQTGQNSALSQRILNEISMARLCLLNPPRKRAYDEQLRKIMQSPAPTGKPSPLSSAATSKSPDPLDFVSAPISRTRITKKKPQQFPWQLVAVGICVLLLAGGIVIFSLGENPKPEKEVAALESWDATKPPVPPKADVKSRSTSQPQLEAQPVPELVQPKPTVSEHPQEAATPQSEPKTEPAPEPEPTVEPAPEPEPEASPKERLAVPDANAQEKALAIVRDVYKKDYKDKAALAKKLLQIARETQEPTNRFVLLQEAGHLAAEPLQSDVAFEAVDAMVREYTVSALELKADILDKAVKQTRSTAEQKMAIAETALRMIDDAMEDDNFDIAKQLGKQAIQMARLANSPDLLQAVLTKNKEVEAAAKAYADAQEAIATYEKNPNDPEANLTIGKYLCLSKGNWEKGLPMLALGSDEKLRELAKKDLEGAATTGEQAKLGNAWWEAGGRQRAAYWYEKALPELSGLEKDRAEKRIAEAGSSTTSGRTIDLLAPVNPAKNRVEGEWKKSRAGLTLAAKAPDGYARVLLPATVEGNYDLAVSFTRSSGTDAVAVMIPVGANTGMVLLSHGDGRWCGLEMIDGKGTRGNPTTYSPGRLTNGKRHNLLIKVRLEDQNASVEVVLDKTSIIRWQGKESSLSLYHGWRLPQAHRVGVGAREPVTFHSVQLKILPGKTEVGK